MAIKSELEPVRYHKHLLIGVLLDSLILAIGRKTGVHYEGLASAGKAIKPIVGNTVCTKLRLIDEAYNLTRHISPESALSYIDKVEKLLEPDGVGRSGKGAFCKGKAASLTGSLTGSLNTSLASIDTSFIDHESDCSSADGQCHSAGLAAGGDENETKENDRSSYVNTTAWC